MKHEMKLGIVKNKTKVVSLNCHLNSSVAICLRLAASKFQAV